MDLLPRPLIAGTLDTSLPCTPPSSQRWEKPRVLPVNVQTPTIVNFVKANKESPMKCFNYVDQGCRCLNLDDKEKLDKVVKTTRLDSGVYVFFRDDRQKSETEDSYSSSTT